MVFVYWVQAKRIPLVPVIQAKNYWPSGLLDRTPDNEHFPILIHVSKSWHWYRIYIVHGHPIGWGYFVYCKGWFIVLCSKMIQPNFDCVIYVIGFKCLWNYTTWNTLRRLESYTVPRLLLSFFRCSIPPMCP